MSTGQAECSLLFLFFTFTIFKIFWPLKVSIQGNILSLHKEGNVKKVAKEFALNSSYPSGSGRIGGSVCLLSFVRPSLLSEPSVRTLSWSESISCKGSRPLLGRVILGREPSYRDICQKICEHDHSVPL